MKRKRQAALGNLAGPLSLIAACVITVGIVWYQFETLQAPGTEQSVANDDVDGAWVYMCAFVEKRLKSPSSASFPWGGAQGVTQLGGGRYRVSSYVDAQNSFGAQLRKPFNGVIKRVGGRWELESLNFGASPGR